MAGWTNEGLLAGLLAWIVGIVVGLLFAALAYLYYAVSVIIGLGSIGFLLGANVMVAFDIRWTWLVVLIGVLVGVVLAGLAIALDAPTVFLVGFTALGGASAIVGGLMLLSGVIDRADLNRSDVIGRIDESPLWWLLFAALVIVGILAQLRLLGAGRPEPRRQYQR